MISLRPPAKEMLIRDRGPHRLIPQERDILHRIKTDWFVDRELVGTPGHLDRPQDIVFLGVLDFDHPGGTDQGGYVLEGVALVTHQLIYWDDRQ
jgi:hypothetical protein